MPQSIFINNGTLLCGKHFILGLLSRHLNTRCSKNRAEPLETSLPRPQPARSAEHSSALRIPCVLVQSPQEKPATARGAQTQQPWQASQRSCSAQINHNAPRHLRGAGGRVTCNARPARLLSKTKLQLVTLEVFNFMITQSGCGWLGVKTSGTWPRTDTRQHRHTS